MSKWLDRSLAVAPYFYRLCLTEKEFHKELRRMKLKRDDWPPFLKTTHAHATANYFERPVGDPCCIICLGPVKGRTRPQIYSLLVHEAVHLWQWICDYIGEKSPSAEFEAYSIQTIAQRLMESYEDQR